MQLEGNISEFPLRELIEMIVYSSVTGVLELGAQPGGKMFFRDGLPYDAVCGDATGTQAVAQLFEAQGAAFRFVAGDVSQGETLWLDPWELIERCESEARQWAAVRPHIPSLDAVPALHQATPPDQIHISDTAWPLLSVVDGQRSIAEIADALMVTPLDVCTGLTELLQQRLISLHPPRPPAPESAPQNTAAHEADGFFERLITRTLDEERRRTTDPTLEQISDPSLRSRVSRD